MASTGQSQPYFRPLLITISATFSYFFCRRTANQHSSFRIPNKQAIGPEDLLGSAQSAFDGAVHIALPFTARVFVGKKDPFPWKPKQSPSDGQERKIKVRVSAAAQGSTVIDSQDDKLIRIEPSLSNITGGSGEMRMPSPKSRVYQMAIKAIPNTVTAALVSQNISEVSKFTPKLWMRYSHERFLILSNGISLSIPQRQMR